jgi:hypothetical protein
MLKFPNKTALFAAIFRFVARVTSYALCAQNVHHAHSHQSINPPIRSPAKRLQPIELESTGWGGYKNGSN